VRPVIITHLYQKRRFEALLGDLGEGRQEKDTSILKFHQGVHLKQNESRASNRNNSEEEKREKNAFSVKKLPQPVLPGRLKDVDDGAIGGANTEE